MLYLDCGNTALKCMIKGVITTFKLDDAEFKPLFQSYIKHINAATHVVISSVAQPEISQTIISLLKGYFKQAPLVAISEASFGDLKTGYQVTEQLGVDRWLALIATQHLSAPRIVIDAGSWIKMDVVLEHGQHQGGVIISATPEIEANIFKRFRLTPEDCHASNALFGTSTQQCLCIAKGRYGFVAIAEFLNQWLPVINQPCHIIVSGGHAAQVIQSIKNTATSQQNFILDIQHIENLVLSGLSIRYIH